MNRADAAAILNIDPAASPEETRKAYQELFTEHQFRLTNAPTPGLKSLYQNRLRELDEARDVLLASESADATLDLPTDQPSLPSRGGEASFGGGRETRNVDPPPRPAPPPPPPASKEKSPPAESAKAPRKAEESPRTVSPAAEPGSRRGLMIGAAVAVIVVIGGFVAYRMGRTDTPSCGTPPCAGATTDGNAYYPDSVPALRENVVLARMELQRPEPNYPVVKKAVEDGEAIVKQLPPSADNDTSVAQLKVTLSQQRTKLNRVCDALRKVAEHRHEAAPPGCS